MNGMGAHKFYPKKTFVTFLPNILNVKSKCNSLRILQKPTSSFQETQICFTECIGYRVFSDHQPLTMRGVLVVAKPSSN